VNWLIKNGIPFDVAWSYEEHEVMAHAIIFSEFNLPEDQHFDFKTMKFREPRAKNF